MTATATQTPIDAALAEGHERVLLAHLMNQRNGRDACDKFLHRLRADVFSLLHHRYIFNAIHDAYDLGDEINFVTVTNRLSEKRDSPNAVAPECSPRFRLT